MPLVLETLLLYLSGVRAALIAFALVVVFARPVRAQGEAEAAEPDRTTLAMEARLALLRGDAARFNNQAGFGFGITADYRWGQLGPVLLSAGGDLFFDRFSTNETLVVTTTADPTGSPREVSLQDTRQLTHTSFVGMQRARLAIGRWAGVAGGGGGFSVSHFHQPINDIVLVSQELPSEERTSVVPLIRAEGGLWFDAWRDTALYVQLTYNWLFSSERVSSGKPFTDVMDIGFGAAYHF